MPGGRSGGTRRGTASCSSSLRVAGGFPARTTRTDVSAGDVVLFQRGEHHDKGSDTGMTAVMVQVRDLSATRAALDVDP